MTRRARAERYGVNAEKIACWLLRLKGYEIIATRHRTAFSEIDVVAWKGHTLAIVEVKARQNFRDCLESMTPTKQQQLVQAANALLAYPPAKSAGRIQSHKTKIRFDLIMVVPWRLPRHLTGAWRP